MRNALLLVLGAFFAMSSSARAADLWLNCHETRLELQNGAWEPVELRDALMHISTDGGSILPHLEGGLDRGVNTFYVSRVKQAPDGSMTAELQKAWGPVSQIFPTEDQFQIDGVASDEVALDGVGTELHMARPLALSYFSTIIKTQNTFGYWTFSPADLGRREWLTLRCEESI